MRKLYKIIRNYKRVLKLVDLIRLAYKDKKVTGKEAEEVLDEAIEMLVSMGLIDAE